MGEKAKEENKKVSSSAEQEKVESAGQFYYPREDRRDQGMDEIQK